MLYDNEKLSFDDIYAHLKESSIDFSPRSDKFIKDYAIKLSSYADFVTCRDISGNLQGIIAYYANKQPIAFISHVWVANRLRGGGICGKMLSQTIAKCQNRGMKVIRLEVRNDNMSAITAYHKFGFSWHESREDTTIMQYIL